MDNRDFTALDPFHDDHGDAVCVAALDVAIPDQNGKATADQMRDAEADAIAELCARLIDSHRILDRRADRERLCQPGDIALLAPTGTDLWRYEEALERRGIPVATQAGKGLFRRQEIQDLIALTRVLADQRDTLALGALLRGPLVGLSEEEILDIVWSLPRSESEPDRLPRLDTRRRSFGHRSSLGPRCDREIADASQAHQQHHALRSPLTSRRFAAGPAHSA